jgi:oligopeptide transport system ATP-binding protein
MLAVDWGVGMMAEPSYRAESLSHAEPLPGAEPLLRVEGLKKYFPIPMGGVFRRRFALLKAVDGVSFSIPAGTCFGVAGESGSGKTTVNKLILLSEKATDGKIIFDGKNIATLDRDGVKWYRRHVQPVFQDASSSLDPNMRICDIVAEPLQIQNRGLSKASIRSKSEEMLGLVGLGSQNFRRYPHELSGGQKQRVAIARAIILDPSLVILDEPVSALDVSIRAQILNLLADIQEEKHLTYLVIAHDLAMLRQVTSRIAVMYLGKVVEIGETDAVFSNPTHPYTRGLLQAVPRPEPRRKKARPALYGEIADPLNLPAGCRFSPRCEERMPGCDEFDPPLVALADGHLAACRKCANGL